MHITATDQMKFGLLKHRDGKRAALMLVKTATQEHVEFVMPVGETTRICREFLDGTMQDVRTLDFGPTPALAEYTPEQLAKMREIVEAFAQYGVGGLMPPIYVDEARALMRAWNYTDASAE